MGFLIHCLICKGGFKDGRPFTGTWGVPFPSNHHLFEFCDGGLHLDCLDQWPHRLEYSRGYFDMAHAGFVAMGTLLHDSPTWILGCGPARAEHEPYYAEVRLADWPMRLYTKFDAWPEFVASGYREGLAGRSLLAADEVMRQVADLAPDLTCIRRLRNERLRRDVV
jgi:hypothetical protein